MKIVSEIGLEEFNAWSGAVTTKERIIEEGKEREFEDLIEECYPEGLTDTELNDLLWFEDEWLFESLGIVDEEEEEEEEEDYDWEDNSTCWQEEDGEEEGSDNE